MSRTKGMLLAKVKAALKPKRTREHIIASQSENYVEKFFIDEGHVVDRPTDYGTDLMVSTFDNKGYAESGNIRLQLKASDSPKYSTDKTYISYQIEVKHYRSWKAEPMPVFLIIYDAKVSKAFWLYTQESFKNGVKPRKNADTMTLRIPVKNKFTKKSVDYMCKKKAAVLAQIKVVHNA